MKNCLSYFLLLYTHTHTHTQTRFVFCFFWIVSLFDICFSFLSSSKFKTHLPTLYTIMLLYSASPPEKEKKFEKWNKQKHLVFFILSLSLLLRKKQTQFRPKHNRETKQTLFFISLSFSVCPLPKHRNPKDRSVCVMGKSFGGSQFVCVCVIRGERGGKVKTLLHKDARSSPTVFFLPFGFVRSNVCRLPSGIRR